MEMVWKSQSEEANKQEKEKWVKDLDTQLRSFSDSSIEVREHKFGVNPVLEDKSYFKS